MLLGAVGAYDWNGTVVMQSAGKTVIPERNAFFDSKTEAGYERLAGYLGELGQMLVSKLDKYRVYKVEQYLHTHGNLSELVSFCSLQREVAKSFKRFSEILQLQNRVSVTFRRKICNLSTFDSRCFSLSPPLSYK